MVVVQPGGIVEVHSSELPVGATVEVIVLLPTHQSPQRGLSDFIGAAQGNFASPEEVDQFIRQGWHIPLDEDETSEDK